MTTEVKKTLTLMAGALGVALVTATATAVLVKVMDHANSTPGTAPAAPVITQTAPAVTTDPETAATNAASTPAAVPAQPAAAVANQPTPPSSPFSSAAPADNSSQMAQIIKATPHYVMESVPYRSCHEVPQTVYVQTPSNFPGAGALIGGAAGAIAGHQVGGGNGKIVGSVAGAIIGAVSGNAIQNSMNQPQAQTVYTTVCHTHYMQKAVRHGYEVTYIYNGQQSVALMAHLPESNFIPIAEIQHS